MLNPSKILLVHPLCYGAEAAGRDVSRLANLMPPLGIASLAAYLEQRGVATTLIDCFARPNSDSLIAEFLRTEQPAFIGFSCTTSSFLDGVRLAKLAKTVLPGVYTVFGGPHVSALKGRILEVFDAVDFIIVGEGEATLAELVACGGEDAASVSGLMLRSRPEGLPLYTGHRTQSLELDSLPFPAYDKLEGFPGAYKLPIFNYPRTPNTSCISSRGCPYACSYCDRSVFGRTFRYNSAEYLYEHMRHLRQRFGIRHINFYDDQFTFHRGRVEELCDRVCSHVTKRVKAAYQALR